MQIFSDLYNRLAICFKLYEFLEVPITERIKVHHRKQKDQSSYNCWRTGAKWQKIL